MVLYKYKKMTSSVGPSIVSLILTRTHMRNSPGCHDLSFAPAVESNMLLPLNAFKRFPFEANPLQLFHWGQTIDEFVQLKIDGWKASSNCVIRHATQKKSTYLCRDQDPVAMKMEGGRLWHILALIHLSWLHFGYNTWGFFHNMWLLIGYHSNIRHGRPWINRVSDNHY